MRASLPGLPLDAVPRLTVAVGLGTLTGVVVGLADSPSLGLQAGIAATELFFVLGAGRCCGR
ncbi:hypothetical protein ABZ871_23530 [Streptomyces populi]